MAPSSVKDQACVVLVFAGDMRVSLLVGQEIGGDGEIVCAQVNVKQRVAFSGIHQGLWGEGWTGHDEAGVDTQILPLT